VRAPAYPEPPSKRVVSRFASRSIGLAALFLVSLAFLARSTAQPAEHPPHQAALALAPTPARVCLQSGVAHYDGAADTYLDRSFPNAGYGDEALIRVSAGEGQATLISFDLGVIPASAVVRTATLRLTPAQSRTNPVNLQAYQVYREWEEDQANWNRARHNSAWASAGCNDTTKDRAGVASAEVVLLPTDTQTTFNLAGLAQIWINSPTSNQGLLIKGYSPSAASTYAFWSSEADTVGLRPQLCVEYQAPAGTTGQIAGIVWADFNANRKREDWEEGLAGARVELWRADGSIPLDAINTSASGVYLFTALQPNVYRLREVNPNGYVSTTPDEQLLTVTAGALSRLDFGDRLASSVTVRFPLIGQVPTYTPTATRPPATATPSATSTPTPSKTATHTPSRTFTPTPSYTFTPTASRTSTATASRTPTLTSTVAHSPTPTATPTPTPAWSAGLGLPGKQVNALLRSSASCNSAWAGVDDLGVYRTLDGGQNWHRRGLNSIVMVVTAVAGDDTRLYAATWGDGVLKSADAGATWIPSNVGLEDHAWLYELIVEAAGPARILYVGTADAGVYRSSDDGATWYPVIRGLSDLNVRSLALATSESSEILYAGVASQGLFKSTNQGDFWEKTALPAMRVRDVIADPFDPDIVYVATDNGVFRSTDGGATWPAAYHQLGGKRVNTLLVAPSSRRVLYAGLENEGVYRSDNAGGEWEPLSAGQSELVGVRALTAGDEAAGCTKLYAGTLAGAVWAWR